MNTQTAQNSSSSLSIVEKAKKLIPSRLTTVLVGMGIMANTSSHDTAAQTLSSNATMTQTGSSNELGQVEQQVTAILEQPPEDILKVRAITILSDASKREPQSFRDAAEQEEFFHILTALQQNKKTKEEAIFTVYDSGRDYLRLFNDDFLKNTFPKTNRHELAKLMVN